MRRKNYLSDAHGTYTGHTSQDKHRISTLKTRLKSQEFTMEALFWASTTNHKNMARVILQHGSRVGIVVSLFPPLPSQQRTLLFKTKDPMHDDYILDFVLRERTALALHEGEGELNPRTGTQNWTTVLHHAVGISEYLLLKRALAEGAAVDQRDYLARTALHIAAGNGNAAAMRMLLDAGASVVPVDWEGKTPLMEARRMLTQRTIQMRMNGVGMEVAWMLLECHEIGWRDEMGIPLLHLAVRFGHVGFVERILGQCEEEGRERVNERDDYGYTALHEACLEGAENMVRVLVRAGADVTLKDPWGRTLWQIVPKIGMVDELREYLRELQVKMAAQHRRIASCITLM